MSKNIVIQEGNISRLFGPVNKQRLSGGNNVYSLWVEKSETRLITKRITKNGLYTAAADGAYGYSSVTVDVESVSGITGTGSDGKQHTITSDPSTGQLVDTVAPVSIGIVQMPLKLDYNDGDTVDVTGIIIHAYDSDGVDLGPIPISEIIIDPHISIYDQNADYGYATIDSDEITINQPVVTSNAVEIEFHFDKDYRKRYTCDDGIMVLYKDSSLKEGWYELYAYSDVATPNIYELDRRSGLSGHVSNIGGNVETIIDGKTVYYSTGAVLTFNLNRHSLIEGVEYNSNGAYGSANLQIATTLFDGVIKHGSKQTINVAWARPGDNFVLSTSFDILVKQSGYSGATGGGGGTSGGGAGRD